MSVATQTAGFDPYRVRKDFPILDQEIGGKPLAYLDNAATAQKPRSVLDALERYYTRDNANIHRGVHTLSARATQAYEDARNTVARFLGAREAREIVLLRGTTEAINLVAQSFGRKQVEADDEVLITWMEHHSNIVPWQLLCEEKGAKLRVAPVNDRGELELEAFERLLGPKTRIVAVTHVSNALGTINPVEEIVRLSHQRGIPVLLDGAQAVPHIPVNVDEIGCDFYAFSSHKLFGPTGTGALYARAELLEMMPPWQGGGEMIASVSFDQTTYNEVPHKFEAGTPNIAGPIGMAAAIEYVQEIGYPAICAHEDELLRYGTELLAAIPEVRLIGTAREKVGVLSFVVGGIHPHDIGTILDHEGVAIRTGHHCAQPLMDRFGVPATARASLAFYNTREEIDALASGLRRVIEMFR